MPACQCLLDPKHKETLLHRSPRRSRRALFYFHRLFFAGHPPPSPPPPAAAHMLRQILLHPCRCGAIFLALVQAAREITRVSLCRSGSRADNASPLRCLLERSLQSAGSCSGPSGRGGSCCGGPALRAPAGQPAGQLLVRQQFIGRLSGEGRAGQTQQRDTGSSV